MFEPIPLARLPTPLEPLPRTSERLGTDIWVKRDDLTGSALSGNKVRKLEFLMADALAQSATTVITCGGIQSNHCRATAIAARRLGLQPVLLLRGTKPAPDDLDGNLLLDALLGARIFWTDAKGYAHRNAVMIELAHRSPQDERCYIVPEGGSNAIGAMGFLRAGLELAEQSIARGIGFDTIICAVGSGGTVAGLAMAGLGAQVLGVAVTDDQATFRERIAGIGQDATRFGLSIPEPGPRWDILDGFQGRGYGLSRPEELRSIATLARETGLLLDPVYTGKAWHALEQTLLASPGSLGKRVLFWHTGGIFGLFGRGAEFSEALDDAPVD